ncbi:MAG: ubiquinol-cytochrome c reductase iron-sulfur subunit [Verrucomicrobiota bacterium]
MIIGEIQAAGSANGTIILKLSTFTALQSANSSIRIALNSFGTNGPFGAFYPILVNRTTGNQFYALEARCTHEGCVVPPSGGFCPCHSSRFNPDGTVLQGPAASPLTRYPIAYDGTNLLTIEIPGLGYSVTGSPVQTTPGPRFQLTFPTQSGLTYEVQFRENIEAAGAAVPLFATANGTGSTMTTSGSGSDKTVYVNRSTAKGFYTVNVRVTQS